MPHRTTTVPRLGVNYVPSEHWWYAWHDWTPDSIQRDLDAVAELGCDHVRIQCLWNWFQPSPRWVSPSALARLHELLDWCQERQLLVCVTLLDGWLSGFDFRPEWLLDINGSGQRSIFTDPFALDHTEWFVETMVSQTHHHPAVWCYDLANEPGVLANWNPHRSDSLVAWTQRMLHAVRRNADGKPAVAGYDNTAWTSAEPGPGRHFAAREPDIATVHAWPKFTGALDRFGEQSLGSWGIADFLAQAAHASQLTGVEPVWVQEVGVAPQWVTHGDAPGFADRMLDRLATTDVQIITWWCSHDVDRRFVGFVPLEYELGLLDSHNAVKPIGEVFKRFVQQWSPATPPQHRSTAMVIDRDRPADLDLLGSWVTADEQIGPCALVDADRAGDHEYLSTRGITTVVQAPTPS